MFKNYKKIKMNNFTNLEEKIELKHKTTIFLNGQKYVIIYKTDNRDLNSIDNINITAIQRRLNITLKQVLDYFNFEKDLFVIEYQNIICDEVRSRLEIINDFAKIEVISIVGGG